MARQKQSRRRIRTKDAGQGKNPLIRLEKLVKTYDSGRVAVHALVDIDLDIHEGEYVAIMGSSGSGKSTLMHILGCLDTPTSGKYYLKGQEVSHYEPDQLAKLRCKEVGFVFQQFNLLPRLTAAQNVELPLLYSGASVDKREEVVEEMLAKVGLSDRGHHRPNELSGGESQRVAIARAMTNNPAILLADEPTGNLDTTNEEEIMAILDELNRQGRTVIVVTHDDTVAKHAKRTVHLLDGRIL